MRTRSAPLTTPIATLAAVLGILAGPVRVASAQPAPAYTPIALTAEEATADARLLREALERIHPGLTRYTPAGEIDAAFDLLERACADGATDFDLYRDIMLLLARIRCDHTKAELPEAIDRFRRESPTFAPVGWRAIGDRLFLTAVGDGVEGAAPGDEVLSINGAPVGGVIRLVESCISVDGWTDLVKANEIGGASEWLGDSLGHVLPFFHGFADSFTLEVRAGDDAPVRTVTLDAVVYDDWLAINTRGGSQSRNFDDEGAVVSEVLPGNVGYLMVETFVNYRTNADPRTLLAPHFQRFRDAGCETVIFDLRNCGGGSTDVPGALLRYFADRPFTAASRPFRVRTYNLDGLREHLSTWEEIALNPPPELFTPAGEGWFEISTEVSPGSFRPVAPYDDRFDGRLIVLTGPQNASGATNFCAVLREFRDDLLFVGQPTGGSAEGTTAGVIFFLRLPNSGVTVRIPYYQSFNTTGDFTPGMGIVPDILVPETVADFRSGRDAALERALELARDADGR
jgi:hypothetical protein